MVNERDFSDQDLRNRSFRNQDLRGADFSRSDIRSCDFSGAKLQNASFEEAHMGLSYQHIVLMITWPITFVILVAVIFYVTVLKGFIAFGVIVIVVFATELAVKVFVDSDIVKRIEIEVDVALRGMLDLILGSISGVVAGKHTLNVITNIIKTGEIRVGIASSLLPAILLFVLAGTAYLAVVKKIRDANGTLFEEADLARATFHKTVISNTSFKNAKLDFVNWKDAHLKISQPKIPQLLIDRNGRERNYINISFKKKLIQAACLQKANLSQSRLDYSDLTYSNLRKANLTTVRAIGTNFSSTDFTGAIIQDWVITKDTTFKHVQCEYVYLSQDRNPQSRRPLTGNFRAGEFENLVTHLTQALGFILHHDDDPEAFFLSLSKLIQTYGKQGLEPGDIIRLPNGDRQFIINTPLGFDNAKAHAEATANYEHLRKELAASRQENQYLKGKLEGKDEIISIQEKENQFLKYLIPTLPIGNNNTIMNDSSNNQNIKNIGSGDISGLAGRDISGIAGKNQQGIAGRDLSGEVTIAINSLKETDNNPETPNLANLLAQLQTAINESDADEKQKNTLLAQVKKLAETAKLSTSEGLKEAAAESINLIETITGIIPALGKAVTGLLTAISTYFTNLP